MRPMGVGEDSSWDGCAWQADNGREVGELTKAISLAGLLTPKIGKVL